MKGKLWMGVSVWVLAWLCDVDGLETKICDMYMT